MLFKKLVVSIFVVFLSLESFAVSLPLNGVMTTGKIASLSAKIMYYSKTKGSVDLHIDSPGGSLAAALIMVNTLTRANVNVYVRRYAASGAAVTVCYGKRKFISPGAVLMFHTVQNPNPVTVSNAKRSGMTRSLRLWVQATSRCPLTKNEIFRIFYRGEDIYISGANFSKRSGRADVSQVLRDLNR